MSSSSLSRRALLSAFAATPLVTTGIGAFPATARAEAEGAGLITPNVCMIAPETTAGPYYLDPGLVRQDIREDRAGAPMTIALQVVQPDCTPIGNARVDVWHCDALGNYSGHARQGSDSTSDTSGETFLRGTQFTDATGTVRFLTIYPGWYRGRTTHVHYMIHLDGDRALTSQMFFPGALSAYLYRYAEPYSDRPAEQDTTNDRDGIARRAGKGAFAQVREMEDGYHAALVVGIGT